MVPSMELIPPKLDATMESQDVQSLADKPSIEETSSEKQHEKEQTAEPFGHIVITDPPTTTTTLNPAATAGKWPMEEATTERDDENET